MAAMETSRLLLYDGVKTSLLWDESTDAWTYYSNAPDKVSGDLYRTIPVLYRGVSIISDALTKVPFSIYRGENEYDTSAQWDNKVGFLPNPRRLLWLVCQSLDRYGCAYLLKTANKAKVAKGLKWLAPSTITPELDATEGLKGFTRRVGDKEYKLKPEEVVYFWLNDSDVELGPPLAYPLKAALIASGVLGNLNDYITHYFGRGAIRPIVVTVKGAPSKDERERMESYFQKMMGGIKKAFQWKVLNADTINIQQIGDGLDQLQNQTLTADQRADVALALGIPQTILFASAANYATSQADQRNFYDMTIIPRCEFISAVINEQLLEPQKLTLTFQPEAMDMYQVEESDRAGSLSSLTNAGVPLQLAMDILGYDLTSEQEAMLEKANAERLERSEEMSERLEGRNDETVTTTPEPQVRQTTMSGDMRSEIGKWYKVTAKALRAGKPVPEFESIIIPPGLHGAIAGALEGAATIEDVKRTFSSLFQVN